MRPRPRPYGRQRERSRHGGLPERGYPAPGRDERHRSRRQRPQRDGHVHRSISDFAFADCPKLKSVTLGNISAAGISIFDNVYTEAVDLTLSKDQKVMTGRDIDGWKSDESEPYANSSDHKRPQFLGKRFHSIKCGRNTYPK